MQAVLREENHLIPEVLLEEFSRLKDLHVLLHIREINIVVLVEEIHYGLLLLGLEERRVEDPLGNYSTDLVVLM
jgi:hypothetical protein